MQKSRDPVTNAGAHRKEKWSRSDRGHIGYVSHGSCYVGSNTG